MDSFRSSRILQILSDPLRSYGSSRILLVPRIRKFPLFPPCAEPRERYEMSPCGEQSCLCCRSVNIERRPYRWPVVNFENTSKHRFCKDYISFLNCPAVSVIVSIGWILWREFNLDMFYKEYYLCDDMSMWWIWLYRFNWSNNGWCNDL